MRYSTKISIIICYQILFIYLIAYIFDNNHPYRLFLNQQQQLNSHRQMTLRVKLIGALLSRDTQVFSNMDPYVVAIVGVDKKRSKTHQEGGKKPKWDETFIFKPTANTMLITVYDEDVVSDDVVGSANIDLKKFINNPVEQQQNFQLTYKGRKSGTIKLSIKYEPNNNSIWGNNNPQPQSNNNSGWGNQQNPNPNNNNSGWGNQPMPNNNNNNTGWNNVQPQPNYGSNWGVPPPPNNNNQGGWGNQHMPNNNNNGWENQQVPSYNNNSQPIQPLQIMQQHMKNMQSGWQNKTPHVPTQQQNNGVVTNPLEVVNTAFHVSQMTQSITRPFRVSQDPANNQNNWQQQGTNPIANNGGWGPNNNGWGNPQGTSNNNGW